MQVFVVEVEHGSDLILSASDKAMAESLAIAYLSAGTHPGHTIPAVVGRTAVLARTATAGETKAFFQTARQHGATDTILLLSALVEVPA
jgi:hypothetical protein